VPQLAGLGRELFHVLSFNSRSVLLANDRIAEGMQAAVPVDPGDVFRAALRAKATAVAFAHNHPAGDASASPTDIALTRQLQAAAMVLCIRVLDHVIVGDGGFTSMRERRLPPFD
jgi:DNA repair protein RadC